MPFEESALPETDTKLLVRWGGGSDLDINVEFDSLRYGWSYNSRKLPYLLWYGDNTNGGPERVSFNSQEIKNLSGFEESLTFNLGAAWYSGYDKKNHWAQFEVTTKDGRCYSGSLNNITQPVRTRDPEYKIEIPYDTNQPIAVTDPQGNPIDVGDQAPKLIAFHGTADKWGGTRSYWNESSFKPQLFSEQGYPLQDNSISPDLVRGNLPTDSVATIPDLTTSYIQIDDKGNSAPSRFTARIGNAGGKPVAKGTPVSFYRRPKGADATQAELIGKVTLTDTLDGGDYVDVSIDYTPANSSLADFGELIVIANDAGAGVDSATGIPNPTDPTNPISNQGVVQEYTRSNNIARIAVTGEFTAFSLAGSVDKTELC